MTSTPLLIVLTGLVGTGKTTLARRLARELSAAYLRVDAVETAVVRCGLTRPPVGYVVCHDIAAGTLAVGTSVVVDAVNPVPEARGGWQALTEFGRLVVFEVILPDQNEYRRRVAARQPDLPGRVVPTWEQVLDAGYVPWDDQRDGPRHVVDMSDADAGTATALRHFEQLIMPNY